MIYNHLDEFYYIITLFTLLHLLHYYYISWIYFILILFRFPVLYSDVRYKNNFSSNSDIHCRRNEGSWWTFSRKVSMMVFKSRCDNPNGARGLRAWFNGRPFLIYVRDPAFLWNPHAVIYARIALTFTSNSREFFSFNGSLPRI